MKKRTAKMKSMRKTRQEAPILQKVNSEKKLTVNSQSQWSTTMMTSTRWCNLMTSARADVVVMTSAMTSTSDQRRVRRVIQFSPKLWSTHKGTWSVRWGQFFSGDVDRRKTIPMTTAVSWSEQYWRGMRRVEKLSNLWLTCGGAWMVRWWWFRRFCVDQLKIYTVICLMY